MTMTDNNSALGMGNSFEIDPAQSSQGLDVKALIGAIKQGQTPSLDMRTKGEPIKPKTTEPLVLSKGQLAEILEAQIKKQIDAFQETYNKVAGNAYFGFRINWNNKVTPESTDYSSVMALELHVSLDGVSRLAYRKAFGYPRVDLEGDQGHGKLTLLNDLLYNLISGGMLFVLAKS